MRIKGRLPRNGYVFAYVTGCVVLLIVLALMSMNTTPRKQDAELMIIELQEDQRKSFNALAKSLALHTTTGEKIIHVNNYTPTLDQTGKRLFLTPLYDENTGELISPPGYSLQVINRTILGGAVLSVFSNPREGEHRYDIQMRTIPRGLSLTDVGISNLQISTKDTSGYSGLHYVVSPKALEKKVEIEHLKAVQISEDVTKFENVSDSFKY